MFKNLPIWTGEIVAEAEEMVLVELEAVSSRSGVSFIWLKAESTDAVPAENSSLNLLSLEVSLSILSIEKDKVELFALRDIFRSK